MARTSTASSTEVLAGLVDRVTFHNNENRFCVLRVKARGQRDLITITGHAANGLSASTMVESLLAMWAAGGERTEDVDQFRQAKALAMLLGHEFPAAQTARDFLAQFHAEDLPLLQH